METVVTIGGVQVIEPTNLNDLKLVITNDTNTNVKRVEFDGDPTWGLGDLRYSNDPFNILDKIRLDGASGGVGVLEAQEFSIITKERGRQIKIAESMIDLWAATYDYEKREISAPLFSKGGTDWISTNTEGVTFDFIMSQGYFTSDEFVLAPYIIEKETQIIEKILVALTAFTLITQIRDQIQSVQEIISESGSMSPWTAVLKIATRVLYIATLLLLLVETLAKIINLLIQPVKYISGMSVKRHFEVGFAFLGMNFKSSIFDGEEQYLTIFPEKYYSPKNKEIDNLKGWIKPDKTKQNGYYKGDFLSFIETFKQYYNAKIIVDQTTNTVIFERRDYVGKVANFQLPQVWSSETLNKEDFKANYQVKFLTDINDRHTIANYSGTSAQVSMSITGASIPQRSLLSGGKNINVPFALFKVKTELSDVEKALKLMLLSVEVPLNALITVVNIAIKAINAVISVINKIIKVLKTIGIKIKVNIKPVKELKKVNFTQKIDERVGIFKMEDDIVSAPKLAYVKNTANALNNKQLKELNADYVLETYHSIDFFSRNTNQYISKQAILTGITFDEVYDIIEADELQNGTKLISLSWSPFNHTAEISVKIPYIYANNNLTETKYVDNGS